MQVNVDQHGDFLPGVEKLEQYLKDVQEGKANYDGKHIVDTIESFGDTMVQHLTDVCYLIESLVIVHCCLTLGTGDVECGSYAR